MLGADGHFYRRQLEGFAEAILSRRPMTGADIDDGLASVRGMVAISQSVRTSQPVRLAEVLGGQEYFSPLRTFDLEEIGRVKDDPDSFIAEGINQFPGPLRRMDNIRKLRLYAKHHVIFLGNRKQEFELRAHFLPSFRQSYPGGSAIGREGRDCRCKR